MMKLDLMKTFFDTVLPDRVGPVAWKILSPWQIAPRYLYITRASANFVLHVKDDRGEYYLRFNHESERSAPMIAAELDFANLLLGRGIKVNVPVPSGSGQFIESVSTSLGTFHAVLFEAITGEMREFDTLDNEAFTLWGRALGKMHAATEGFQADGRPTWKSHIAFAREYILPTEEAAWAELTWIEGQLEPLATGPMDYGLIHYDFELDNILWDGDEIGIIDLDDCAFYWFEADIAFALRDLFDDSIAKIDLGDHRLTAFIDGYRFERAISDEAISRLPLFLRLHNLISTARINRSLGKGHSLDAPDWVVNLDEKLSNERKRCRRDINKYPVAKFFPL